MTVVKMKLVNVGPQVSVMSARRQVWFDADGKGQPEGGGQNGTFYGHSLWTNP